MLRSCSVMDHGDVKGYNLFSLFLLVHWALKALHNGLIEMLHRLLDMMYAKKMEGWG